MRRRHEIDDLPENGISITISQSMELDWLIFPYSKDVNEENVHHPLTSMKESTYQSSSIPILTNSTSCDFADYLHVFDDVESIPSLESSQDAVLASNSPEQKESQNHEWEEKSTTRHIYRSEKVTSSQSALSGSIWTESSVLQHINNLNDPIGKVCHVNLLLTKIVS